MASDCRLPIGVWRLAILVWGRRDLVDEFFRHGLFWITKAIAQGGYPDSRQCEVLLKGGITHLFNVGTAPYSHDMNKLGFAGLVWRPVEDLRRIPDRTAIDCIQTMHDLLREDTSKVYIHCVAGQNRSPSILWLYLVACGMGPAAAEELIGFSSLDAVPRHPDLVDDALMHLAQGYGKAHFFPLRRVDILEPFNQHD